MHSVWYRELLCTALYSTVEVGLVWMGCESPVDCIKVRNAGLAKWLALRQGTLVTVVLFKIFHRRNAVCEYVCVCVYCYIQILNFSISKLCWWFKNICICLVLSVFQQQVFHFVCLLWAFEHVCELSWVFMTSERWHYVIVSVVPNVLQALYLVVLESSAPVRQCHISEDWILSCIAVSTFTPHCVFFVM